MDSLSPFPCRQSGNTYILAVCDYATRYSEAIPLKLIVTEDVTEKHTKLLARVGIRKEVLTDQGSRFMSQLLTKVY